MREAIKVSIVFAYIILSLTACVRTIVLGNSVIDSILGTAGIVMLNLAAWVIFIEGGGE